MKTWNEKRERYNRRQIINSTGLENVPSLFGAEKTCYVFNGFVVFAEHIKDGDLDYSDVLMQKIIKCKNANYLHNAGINTPRLIDIFVDNGYLFEVQEKAPGAVISYTNESNILNTFAGGDSKYVAIKDMSDYLRNDFCKQILAYNCNMQKKLKSAPISHFVDFIKGFKSIQEYGLELDVHGENFLYDVKKGFSFIDLPSVQSTSQKKFSVDNIQDLKLSLDNRKVKSVEKYRKVNDSKVLTQICSLFVDFLKFSNYVFDIELVKQMKKNNLSIIKNKIIPAAKLAGLSLSKQEWSAIENYIKEFTHSKNSDYGLGV